MSNGFCKGSLLIILSALVIISGSFNAAAQTETATGTVVDSSTGEPLIGAVVLLKAKSSTDHVITDLDGRFSLRAPAGSVLEISLMGYVTLEVKAAASMGKIALCRMSILLMKFRSSPTENRVSSPSPEPSLQSARANF